VLPYPPRIKILGCIFWFMIWGVPRILILGGYGNTGLLIARLLLQESDAQIAIVGRNSRRTQRAADELNCKFEKNRVFSKQADPANKFSLEPAFANINIVVVMKHNSGLCLDQAVLNSPEKAIV
ncbi:MAG: saccharopine dehydrogenase NADP-binding domain-containing protein, partial [Cyanobacteria bacterium J06636_16]